MDQVLQSFAFRELEIEVVLDLKKEGIVERLDGVASGELEVEMAEEKGQR